MFKINKLKYHSAYAVMDAIEWKEQLGWHPNNPELRDMFVPVWFEECLKADSHMHPIGRTFGLNDSWESKSTLWPNTEYDTAIGLKPYMQYDQA